MPFADQLILRPSRLGAGGRQRVSMPSWSIWPKHSEVFAVAGSSPSRLISASTFWSPVGAQERSENRSPFWLSATGAASCLARSRTKTWPSLVNATDSPSGLNVGSSSIWVPLAIGSSGAPLEPLARSTSLPLSNATCGIPAETNSVTVSPSLALVPGSGLTRKIVPFSASLNALRTFGISLRSPTFLA